MINCSVQIHQDRDRLDAGQRVAGQDTSTELYSGPAYLSAPSRNWQQAAAFEGAMGSTLHVHSFAGLPEQSLQGATRVTITGHPSAGEWQVLDVSLSGSQWRLILGRRPISVKP